jgi:hypothetical protein
MKLTSKQKTKFAAAAQVLAENKKATRQYAGRPESCEGDSDRKRAALLKLLEKRAQKPAKKIPSAGLVPPLVTCNWLHPEKVFHIDDSPRPEDGFHLVIYVDWDLNYQAKDRPKPKEPEKWVLLAHQTGGHACMQHTILAQFLKPNKTALALFQELGKAFNNSFIMAPPHWEKAVHYQTLLKKFGVSADRHYHELEEGFYPLDSECLPLLTKNRPKTEDIFLRRPKGKRQSLWDIFPRSAHVAILGPNSD